MFTHVMNLMMNEAIRQDVPAGAARPARPRTPAPSRRRVAASRRAAAAAAGRPATYQIYAAAFRAATGAR